MSPGTVSTTNPIKMHKTDEFSYKLARDCADKDKSCWVLRNSVNTAKATFFSGGRQKVPDWAALCVKDPQAGMMTIWHSEAGIILPGTLLFRKKGSGKCDFVFIDEFDKEHTSNAPISFMTCMLFSGVEKRIVVFAAGCGGPSGFGSVVIGKDEDLIAACVAAFSVIWSQANAARRCNQRCALHHKLVIKENVK